MKELSLYLLDLAQNSITANASLISIDIDENPAQNTLTIALRDNGQGMTDEFVKKVTDPFTTTRTTRDVGMGVPLFKLAAEQAGGSFDISSSPGEGTDLCGVFQYNHLDRPPVGDMASSMQNLLMSADTIDFVYTHKTDNGTFVCDTRQLREVLGDQVSLASFDVLQWASQYVREGLDEIHAEKY